VPSNLYCGTCKYDFLGKSRGGQREPAVWSAAVHQTHAPLCVGLDSGHGGRSYGVPYRLRIMPRGGCRPRHDRGCRDQFSF
jgi:hypothetical protein